MGLDKAPLLRWGVLWGVSVGASHWCPLLFGCPHTAGTSATSWPWVLLAYHSHDSAELAHTFPPCFGSSSTEGFCVTGLSWWASVIGFTSQTYPLLLANWASEAGQSNPAVNQPRLSNRAQTAPVNCRVHVYRCPDTLKAESAPCLASCPQSLWNPPGHFSYQLETSAISFKTSSLFPFPPPAINSIFHVKPRNRASSIHILSLSSTSGQKRPGRFVENSMNSYGFFSLDATLLKCWRPQQVRASYKEIRRLLLGMFILKW